MPEAVTPETFSSISNLSTTSEVAQIWEIQPIPQNIMIEEPVAIESEMVYPVEPFPVPRPVMIPPPFIDWPFTDLPFYGWWSEIDSYFYQFCESSSETFECTKYGDVVRRLMPKIATLSDLIKTTFDEEKQDDIKWMIRNIIENKFYEVSTEKSKFTISFIWISLQENLYEEDVEDIDSWLGDAITNLGNAWKIVSVWEAPGDMTKIVWDSISSSNNTFGIEIDARFDSNRPVTQNQWYEVLAHFGQPWAYFIDWKNIRNAQYDTTSKTWKFGSDQYGFRGSWWKVPDSDTVQIYLLCNFCEGEQFHQDRWDASIADMKSYSFTKLDDNLEFDAELEVSNYTTAVTSSSTDITVNYILKNNGISELAWMRTNIWAYPLSDRRWFGDEEVDRSAVTVICAWNQISEQNFFAGNIVLASWQSCNVSEVISLDGVSSWQIEFSIDVEARMDQYWENNNWNTMIEL